jgi:hypothetical protein
LSIFLEGVVNRLPCGNGNTTNQKSQDNSYFVSRDFQNRTFGNNQKWIPWVKVRGDTHKVFRVPYKP